MAAEAFAVTPLGALSTIFAAVHQDGMMFKNTGREQVRVHNGRAAAIEMYAVGVGRCSQGALHDHPDPPASVPAGSYFDFDLLDTYQLNDRSSNTTLIMFTDTNGDPLPDDDTFGHPAQVEIAAIRVV